ncbi:hypothetical protein ACOV5J_02895 [Weissella soli]|uniref:hypothetical protein n=1 Tax=Weissella soli TaxID=155866 RepID=UPI003C7616CB
MADKWQWQSELALAHLKQTDVAQHLGIDKSSMALLVSKMVVGKGLTASELDKTRWNKALSYIEARKEVFMQI